MPIHTGLIGIFIRSISKSHDCFKIRLHIGISLGIGACAPDVRSHQANHRIISAVAQRLTISDERVYSNIERYGNTSSASIGICLDELNRNGKLKKGDVVLLTAFGGGLTWGAELIRW